MRPHWLRFRVQVLVEEREPSARSRALCSERVHDQRLVHVQLKLTGERAMPSATSLAHHLAHSMVSASTCVGLTFPGMMELPGSFSGMRSSPSRIAAPRRAAARHSQLVEGGGWVFSAPVAKTRGSCPQAPQILFGADTNAGLYRAKSVRRRGRQIAGACSARADSRSADRELIERGNARVRTQMPARAGRRSPRIPGRA